jgi:hypothetical protein
MLILPLGGYVVGDNVFVGRWRDCVTPEDFVGYEGTFVRDFG